MTLGFFLYYTQMRKILSKRYRDSAAVNLLADLAIRICFKTLFFLKVETALIKKKKILLGTFTKLRFNFNQLRFHL